MCVVSLANRDAAQSNLNADGAELVMDNHVVAYNWCRGLSDKFQLQYSVIVEHVVEEQLLQLMVAAMILRSGECVPAEADRRRRS
jgi:hypothetical protein